MVKEACVEMFGDNFTADEKIGGASMRSSAFAASATSLF